MIIIVVMNAEAWIFLDATAIDALKQLRSDLEQVAVTLCFARLKGRERDIFAETGLIDPTPPRRTPRHRPRQTRPRRLHLPTPPHVAGIVLFAFGLKTTLHHVDNSLQAVPAVALCGGTALYLLGHVGFMYRSIGRIFRRRIITAILLLALIPGATVIPSLAALALVSGICAAVVAYEAIGRREARMRLRHPDRNGL